MAAVRGVKRNCGFDCEFVKKPPEAIQTKCPLCQQILREPYQAPCCGNSFCRVCIEKTKADNKPCPTCKEDNFVTFHNKGLQLSFYKFEVYCSYKQEGCEWKGELDQLDNHLNLSPQLDKQLEGCDYSEIECIYCSELIKRSNITAHQTEHCPKRSFTCEKCHNYKSHYDDVINNHWPVCGYQTVRCPNECGTTLKRHVLENHFNRSCTKAIIPCVFYHVGCDVKLPRKDMPAHLKENLVTHMSLQAAGYKQLQEKVSKLERENEMLKRQLETFSTESQLQTDQARLELSRTVSEKTQQLEKQIATLELTTQAEGKTLQQIMKSTKVRIYNTTELTMVNYQQHKRQNAIWYSPGFYTHPGGYRLCLRVDTSGTSTGQGTHVSVYAHLMKGDYDDILTWPFKGEVTVKILGKDKKSFEKTILFKSSIPDTHNSRVTEGEWSQEGVGTSMYISHTALETCYITSNCLNFHIKYKEL